LKVKATFFYQETNGQVDNGGYQSYNMSFAIGIQVEWQRDMMLQHGPTVSLLMPHLEQMNKRYGI
jgi:hypothetical protein